MSKNKKLRQAEELAKKKKKQRLIGLGLAILLVFGVGTVYLNMGGVSTEVYAEGIEINKSDVLSEGIKYYDYKVDGDNLQVIAVTASDGSIRTAFNTCQVCYSSGKGYYEPVGNTLVCQNCGNVFTFDDVEVARGGCNPVPIGQGNKTDDGSKITITDEYIRENVALFKTWK